MEKLKDKKIKDYDYTSRYSHIPYYYNTADKKYVYGIGAQMSKDTPYVAHQLKDTDTLDYLALKYYNNPTYFWVIAYFNDINDPYMSLVDNFDYIKIPNISGITFKNER